MARMTLQEIDGWLHNQLSRVGSGMVALSDLKEAGAKLGLSEGQIRAAGKRLGVEILNMDLDPVFELPAQDEYAHDPMVVIEVIEPLPPATLADIQRVIDAVWRKKGQTRYGRPISGPQKAYTQRMRDIQVALIKGLAEIGVTLKPDTTTASRLVAAIMNASRPIATLDNFRDALATPRGTGLELAEASALHALEKAEKAAEEAKTELASIHAQMAQT